MQQLLYIFTLLLAAGCGGADPQTVPVKDMPAKQAEALPDYKTIGEIRVPDTYKRTVAAPGSFAAWLRTVPLKKDKTVYLYNGTVKRNQSAQFAVIDIPTGTKDLQQCADAVMRLRAEYLFSRKIYDSIAFMDYTGKWYKWPGGGNRPAFDNYLQTVFGWCGSASLEKQLKPVARYRDLKAGDVFVQGGFPGHAMLVADVAMNDKGDKIFMLAQGYQPAQDMHVVVNPQDAEGSPWYPVTDDLKISTPEWTFYQQQLREW